jgi:hypothetical protein
MEVLIAAYTIACIDVMVTSQGILSGKGIEGNPLVTFLIPNGHPFQIPALALFTIATFWAGFIISMFYPKMLRFENQIRYYQVVAFGFAVACGTHIFGIVSWII